MNWILTLSLITVLVARVAIAETTIIPSCLEECLEEKANGGDVTAQRTLGKMFMLGKPVKKNLSKAVSWLTKSAEQGDAESEQLLGMIYAMPGDGTIKTDYSQSLSWLRKASDHGNLNAQYQIGLMYHEGRGVEKDDAVAVEWIRPLALHGDIDAQKSLGGILLEMKRFEEARTFISIAANKGDVAAKYQLGMIYAEGKGVERDYREATKWLNRAARQGSRQAKKALATIESSSE